MQRLHSLRAACPFVLGLLTLDPGAAAHAQGREPETIVITGNPLGAAGVIQPVSVLGGNALTLQRAGTLGDTLDGLPGVAASGFGPNASRPVIRGLDGDRVRLLDNGAGLVDASALSFDHGVALDPLIAERVEVLRGPAALLYGGSAAGGVVNTLHNRIPLRRPEGATGRAELRGGGAARERAGAVVLDAGSGALAWHADAFGRDAEDLRVPLFEPVRDGVVEPATRRIANSAARSGGGALGASVFGAGWRLGASTETYGSRYGVVVDPEVTIRMRRERQAVAGDWSPGGTGVEAVAFSASRTRYRHDEVEGDGAVGTTFGHRGDEARVELRHGSLAGMRGLVGMQWDRLGAQALGDEAFVPATRTRNAALFLQEEVQAGGLHLSAGARAEQAEVASMGDTGGATPRFGAAGERRFRPASASLGARLPLGAGIELAPALAASERAPTYYELYANGLHVATGAYERGDATLGVERARHVELGLRWSAGDSHLALQAYQTRYARYIALIATGNDVTLPPENPGDPPVVVGEYAFTGARARLTGWELEGRTRFAFAAAAWTFSGSADAVRGTDLDRNEPLPRLPPRRARLALEAARGDWRLGAAARHAARQDRVAAFDTPTPAYTMLDLWSMVRLPLPGDAQAWLRLTNVTDELGFNAAAVSTARTLSPLPGRAASIGLRWGW